MFEPITTTILTKAKALKDANDILVSQNKALSDQIAQLQGEVDSVGRVNTQLKINISQVQQRNADLLAQMQNMEKADSTGIDEGLKAENALKDANQELQTIHEAVGSKDTSTVAILSEINDMKDTIDQNQKTQQNIAQQSWVFLQAFFTALSKKKKV